MAVCVHKAARLQPQSAKGKKRRNSVFLTMRLIIFQSIYLKTNLNYSCRDSNPQSPTQEAGAFYWATGALNIRNGINMLIFLFNVSMGKWEIIFQISITC